MIDSGTLVSSLTYTSDCSGEYDREGILVWQLSDMCRCFVEYLALNLASSLLYARRVVPDGDTFHVVSLTGDILRLKFPDASTIEKFLIPVSVVSSSQNPIDRVLPLCILSYSTYCGRE